MYFCKTKRHVWSNKKDAEKCCNGYKRVVVFGGDIPKNVVNVKLSKDGLRMARIWVEEERSPFEASIFEEDSLLID